MNDAAVRAALKGAVPPDGDELARDVYGMMLRLAEAYEREQARERGLLAIANFCQNFAQPDGSLSREDVARVETRIHQALADGPARPDDPGRLRLPEKVIEGVVAENRILRERLRLSQVIIEAINRAAESMPPEFYSQTLAGVTADNLKAIAGANTMMLEEDSCLQLIESIDNPRVRELVDRLLSFTISAPATAVQIEVDPDSQARVQRIEAACLRVFAAAQNLAEASGPETVAYGLSVLTMALNIAMSEVQEVTGMEGKLAAALVVSTGREIRMLRETLKQARATLNLLVPGGAKLLAARRTAIQLIDHLLDQPSTLEHPTFLEMVKKAGFDGRAVGGGICPVHGRVRADHSCEAYRPEAS